MLNGNYLTILHHLRRTGSLTRRDLARQMDLGISMVSRLTGELLDLGVIRENGRLESQSGRPSDLLSLEPKAGYAVGLDIGGSHQRAILVDLVGDIVAHYETNQDLPASREGILESIASLVGRVQVSSGIPEDQLFGLGIGLWGSVDPRGGVVYSWTETPELYATWKDFALRGALQERLPFPHIYIDDVVRTMGLAEVLYGDPAARDQDFVFALADTGIGVALMINGQAYVGPNQLAGEIGHIPVGGNRPCNCGNTGCIETVASVRAIVEQARHRIEEMPTATVLRECQNDLCIQKIIQAAETGDKLAYQVITDAGEKFGVGLAIAANLFGPRLITVGGILSGSNVYLDAAKRMVRFQALGKVNSDLSIVASRLDYLAGARGAASQVLNRLFAPEEKNILALKFT